LKDKCNEKYNMNEWYGIDEPFVAGLLRFAFINFDPRLPTTISIHKLMLVLLLSEYIESDVHIRDMNRRDYIKDWIEAWYHVTSVCLSAQ
jgi:hypothetical protein